MSKTRGNTMDPLELVEKYGTDALRFALTTGAAPGSDIRFTEGRLEAARNFANKVWNAARFVLNSVENHGGADCLNAPDAGEHRQDRWILSRLHRTTQEVNDALAGFELGEAQQKLYDFIWDDYCDWYIEMAKVRLRSGLGPSPLPVLVHVLERTLRLLHPFMPFVTEEIWQHLRSALPQSQSGEEGLSESIMVCLLPPGRRRLPGRPGRGRNLPGHADCAGDTQRQGPTAHTLQPAFGSPGRGQRLAANHRGGSGRLTGPVQGGAAARPVRRRYATHRGQGYLPGGESPGRPASVGRRCRPGGRGGAPAQ